MKEFDANFVLTSVAIFLTIAAMLNSLTIIALITKVDVLNDEFRSAVAAAPQSSSPGGDDPVDPPEPDPPEPDPGYCGDDICQVTWESCLTCPDCLEADGSCIICPNGWCEDWEDCRSCPTDCGHCPEVGSSNVVGDGPIPDLGPTQP
jgi:hypothetical protein